MRKWSKEQFHEISLLSQQWSDKNRNIADYACNVFAHKIVKIDLVLKTRRLSERKTEMLNALRERLVMEGQALWIMEVDTLTNLGIRVGHIGETIDVSKDSST